MAERFWPERGAVGQSLNLGEETVTVVGVAQDSRTMIQDDASMPHLYLSSGQSHAPRLTLLVRTTGEPVEAAGCRATRDLGPSTPT